MAYIYCQFHFFQHHLTTFTFGSCLITRADSAVCHNHYPTKVTIFKTLFLHGLKANIQQKKIKKTPLAGPVSCAAALYQWSPRGRSTSTDCVPRSHFWCRTFSKAAKSRTAAPSTHCGPPWKLWRKILSCQFIQFNQLMGAWRGRSFGMMAVTFVRY